MPCATPECLGIVAASCSHGMYAACCRIAQDANGIVCDEHLVSSGGSSSSDSVVGSDGPAADPILQLRDHIGDKRVLGITSPMLAGCAHSLLLYELGHENRGIELINRKTDTYVATHIRFKDDCQTAANFAKIISKLLADTVLRRHPLHLLDLLRLPLRLHFAIVYVHGNLGYAGSRTFLARADETDPPVFDAPRIHCDLRRKSRRDFAPLTFENTRQDEMAAGCNERAQQWREQHERIRQNVRDHDIGRFAFECRR